MKISLIIVNHNGVRFLPRLFESIKTQSHPSFETILVDTESTDTSISLVRDQYPTVRIVQAENRGFGFAANQGAIQARGTHLMFFNEDMYMPPDFLERMCSFRKKIDSETDPIAVIGCKIIPFDTDPTHTEPYLGGGIDLFAYPYDIKNPKKQPFTINGSPFMMETQLFLTSKGFHEAIFLYGEDTDLCWRLRLLGYGSIINNQAYLFHYGGGVTGGISAKKVGHIVYGSLVGMVTNYSILILFLIFPFYFLYIISIHMGLFLVMKGNYVYNKELVLAGIRFIQNIGTVFEMRSFVQKNRVIPEWMILSELSFIPSAVKNMSIRRLHTSKVK